MENKALQRIFFDRKISRKRFLKLGVLGLAFISFNELLAKAVRAFARPEVSKGRVSKGIKGDFDLVVAKGDDPYQLTVKAIEAMGGMSRFVKENSTVLIKPNIGWDRAPEQAANTNPDVVAALVDMCFQAKAKRVNVFDRSCNEARRCYSNSGIEKIAKEHGANVFFPDSWNVVKADFLYESPMQNWPVFREAIECDTFINVPVLKHHGLTGLTISMKNLMGVCAGIRGQIHQDIGRKLVDLTDFIKPDLNVVDAFRVLRAHGPSGGDLNDVVKMKTVIAGTDAVLTDAYAADFFGEDPFSLPNIQQAKLSGFGATNISSANIKKIEL
ncbi:MAG: DUF362 domain-containing protein [Candidatus Omnitrophica bacterium]|nr:DUF362 domain-containing protein [Candidatus Omnitrophota bacterium]